jgi:hypothetical protein
MGQDRTRRVAEPTRTAHKQAGVCRGAPPYRYILGLLSICGFVTTLSGGWCGLSAPPWEVGLGLLVVELIFTYVCVSLYQ